MAIVEHLAERVSLKAAAGCLGAAWIVWTVIQRVSEHRRIKALGSYATNIPSWAPLGKIPYTYVIYIYIYHTDSKPAVIEAQKTDARGQAWTS